MERAKRIELSSQPWQGRVLPLNHARKNGKHSVKNKRVISPFISYLITTVFGVTHYFFKYVVLCTNPKTDKLF